MKIDLYNFMVSRRGALMKGAAGAASACGLRWNTPQCTAPAFAADDLRCRHL